MLVYKNYLLIAGESNIYFINYMSKNNEILSFYLYHELTNVINIAQDRLIIGLFNNENNQSIIREFNIYFKGKNINFECICEGFCEMAYSLIFFTRLY